MHKSYDEHPLCPCCLLPISQEYIETHLRVDHTNEEKARALARESVEDYQEMYEYTPELEKVEEQKA